MRKCILQLTLVLFVTFVGINPLSCSAANSQLQGFSYLKAKNYAKALESFNAALKEQPKSWVIMQSIGNCHMELGQYDAAIVMFQKSIEVGGLHADQCTNMAAVYQRLGQPQKALNWRRPPSLVDHCALRERI